MEGESEQNSKKDDAKALYADNSNSAIGVIPVDDQPHNGHTYAEWSEIWWKWALEIPIPDNPLLDVTGDRADYKQDQAVWFLAGTTGGPPVFRECIIPSGKPLFFPIINVEYSEQENVNYRNYPSLDIFTDDFIDRVTYKDASVDGNSIIALDRQRVKSGQFNINFPKNNIYEYTYGVRSGNTNAVADGYYVLMQPLSQGNHVLKFAGEVRTIDNYIYSSNVTYKITVK